MNLRIVCQSEPLAVNLARDILQQVRNGDIPTWNYASVKDDELSRSLPCIYHDNEQTRQEDKVAYFHVYQQSTEVRCHMYLRRGSNLERNVKLWLLGRLAEMIISHYITKFDSMHFGTI